MAAGTTVRWRWLRLMYIWTIVGAGGFGLLGILSPQLMVSLLGFPAQDPFLGGVMGSINVSFAILSILGLRSPLKFVPVLFSELCYKSVWFIVVLLPRVLAGQVPSHALILSAIFATYVIGDLIAIPFPWLFARES